MKVARNSSAAIDQRNPERSSADWEAVGGTSEDACMPVHFMLSFDYEHPNFTPCPAPFLPADRDARRFVAAGRGRCRSVETERRKGGGHHPRAAVHHVLLRR